MKKNILSKTLLFALVSFFSMTMHAQYTGGEGRGDVMSERLDIQLDGEDCFPSSMSVSQTTCSSFTLNGQTYTESGTYTQIFVNSEGCDSVLTLFLNVEVLQSSITASACSSYELNGETYTESGTYSQMLTNASGCDSLITLNLTIGEGDIVLGVTPESPVSFCVGASVELIAASGFDTYTWSHGPQTQMVTINAAGTYSVTATDISGCTAVSENIEVSIIDKPEAGFAYAQTEGYTIEFTNTSTNGQTFLWNFAGGNSSTQENPSYTYPFEGIYPVSLIVSNGCGSDTIFQNINVLKLSVNDIVSSLNYFEIFPNPSSGNVNIKGSSKHTEQYKLRVINVLGQELFNEQFSVNGEWTRVYDFSALSSGVYWFIMEDQKGLMSRKFVLN
jgi:hypothetical protein